MFRTNGRVRKSERKERASVNKEFKCTECGVYRRVGKIEFGEKIECLKCGTEMVEKVD